MNRFIEDREEDQGVVNVRNAAENAGMPMETVNSSLDAIQATLKTTSNVNTARAINGALNGVASGLTQISQGGPANILQGSISIACSAATLLGPEGAIVGSVASGVMSIISSIYGFFSGKQQSLATELQKMIDDAVAKTEADKALQDIQAAQENYNNAITYISNALNDVVNGLLENSGDALTFMDNLDLMQFNDEYVGHVTAYMRTNWSDTGHYREVAEVFQGYVNMLGCNIIVLMNAASLYDQLKPLNASGESDAGLLLTQQAYALAGRYTGYLSNFYPTPKFSALGVLSAIAAAGFQNIDTIRHIADGLSNDRYPQFIDQQWYNISPVIQYHKGLQLMMDGSWGPLQDGAVVSETRFQYLAGAGWQPVVGVKHTVVYTGPFYIVEVDLQNSQTRKNMDNTKAWADGHKVYAFLSTRSDMEGLLCVDCIRSFKDDHLLGHPYDGLWIVVGCMA